MRFRDMKSQIAGGEHTTILDGHRATSAASRVEEHARRRHAARADRQRASSPRGRRSSSATSRSGSGCRRRRCGSALVGARARGARRGRRHGPRARQPADAGGPRGDLRRAPRPRGPGGARRCGCGRATRASTQMQRSCCASSTAWRRRRTSTRYLGTRWDFHAICYLASGRTRLVAEVERLYWRAERYNHLVLSTRRALPALGRVLPRVPRRLRGARRRPPPSASSTRACAVRST